MSADLKNMFDDTAKQREAIERLRRFDGGGGGGYDDFMEARVAKLEEFVTDARERLTKIDTRLDGMDTRMATKADLHENANSMIKWVVGTAALLGVAAITVMTFVLNNAVPKAPASQPAPIIIQVPSQAPPPQPAQK
jgi:hypothetical protein